MSGHVYQNPDLYSKNNSLQYNFAMQILNRANICKTDKVLDLGCGDGRITVEIAKIAHEGCVIGADISEKMIEHSNKIYDPQKNLRFLCMDTSRNVLKNQFNFITSFNSLHWVKDQAQALKGIAHAAMIDAKIVLLLSHKKSTYHHALDTICLNEKWSFYFKNYSNPRYFFTIEEYKELLINAGLQVVSLNEKIMIHQFDSIKSLKGFLSASMAQVKEIPPPMKEMFLDDFCIEFLKQSNCKNTYQIPLSFWCLEVFALKKVTIQASEFVEYIYRTPYKFS